MVRRLLSMAIILALTFSSLSCGEGAKEVPPAPSASSPTTTEVKSIEPTSEDIEWLATVIASEAGSVYDKGSWVRCTDEERAAVGWTVINRLKTGTYGKSIRDIVTAQGQYAHNQEPNAEIKELARKLLVGTMEDNTDGATHFFSPISMPKEGESTAGFDTGGGLHRVSGIDSEVYFPSWTETMTYVGDLKDVRKAYFMFYRSTATAEKPASTGEQPDVAVSSDELFILEKEGIYRERPSAKGKLKIVMNEVKYSPRGEKYWLIAFENITNRVLDIELFVDWKDPSGKSLETETQRDQRFLPEDTSGDEFEFPRGALGPVFWINVEYPEPIPQKIDFSYIDTSSTKGTIDIQNPIIEIHNEGSVYEQWIVPRLEVRNTSKNIILEFEGYFEFYSGGIIMEEQTLAFRNSSPLEPGMSCDIIGGNDTGFHTGGDSYGLNLQSIYIPYEADELRLSIGVTKVLPLGVTINYNVDPRVEQYYQVTFDSPAISEEIPWVVQEGGNWVVQGEFIQTTGYDIYSDDRFAVFEIHVVFDTGQGKLTYYREGYVPPSRNTVEGNPVVAEVKIDRLYSKKKSFNIIYPTEATHAEVKVRFLRIQEGLN